MNERERIAKAVEMPEAGVEVAEQEEQGLSIVQIMTGPEGHV